MQNGKIFENSIFEISFGDKFGNYSYFFNRGGYITATIFASLEIEYGSWSAKQQFRSCITKWNSYEDSNKLYLYN